MARGREDLLQRDEIGSEIGDDTPQLPSALGKPGRQLGMRGRCDQSMAKDESAQTGRLDDGPACADEPRIDA